MICPQLAVGQAQALESPNQNIAASADTVQKEEYLECPNCRIQIKPTPGIPWSGATCPGCKTVMAHFIREVQTKAIAPQQLQAQTQMWDPFPDAHKKFDQGINNLFGVALQQALPGVTQNAQQTTGGIGAGIIVSSKGYVLTNYHLIAPNPSRVNGISNGTNQTDIKVTLFTPNGNQVYPGVIIATDPQNDLAILQIKTSFATQLPVAPLGNSDMLTVGDTVLAFGNPFGLAQTVTDGIVSAKRKNVTIEGHQISSLIQTDAPINQGNSGGPLANINGEVIGINTAIYSPAQTHTGLGFAVPINVAKLSFGKYMDLKSPQAVQAQLVAMGWLPARSVGGPSFPIASRIPSGYGLVAQTGIAVPNTTPNGTASNQLTSVWMGAELQVLNDVMVEQLKVPFSTGLMVNNVSPDSPAATGGLNSGDVIYRVNGRRIINETQMQSFLADTKSGDVVTFSVFRNGKNVDVKITVI
jgi:S1-C subfamily serine protease